MDRCDGSLHVWEIASFMPVVPDISIIFSIILVYTLQCYYYFEYYTYLLYSAVAIVCNTFWVFMPPLLRIKMNICHSCYSHLLMTITAISIEALPAV